MVASVTVAGWVLPATARPAATACWRASSEGRGSESLAWLYDSAKKPGRRSVGASVGETDMRSASDLAGRFEAGFDSDHAPPAIASRRAACALQTARFAVTMTIWRSNRPSSIINQHGGADTYHFLHISWLVVAG